MNVADSTYTQLYTMITEHIMPGFIRIMHTPELKNSFELILVMVIAWTGYRLMYRGMDQLSALKTLLATGVVAYFLFNPIFTMELLKSVFIDMPLRMGEITIDALSNTPELNKISGLSLAPNQDGTTAFGRLWEISTKIANGLWDEGGMTDMGSLFLGAIMYLLAILLLVAQILMLGAGLIMSTAAVLSAPVFLWMILFGGTRRMFESWIGYGLAGAYALYLLMIMIGMIFAFTAGMFTDVFNIDITTQSFDDIDSFDDVSKLSALTLFIFISIKLLPNVSAWAGSLAGASASGFTNVLATAGTYMASKAGLLSAVASGSGAIKALGHKGAAGASAAAGMIKGTHAAGSGMASSLKRMGDRSFNKSEFITEGADQQRGQDASFSQRELKQQIKQRLEMRQESPQARPIAQLAQAENGIKQRQLALPAKREGMAGESLAPALSKTEKAKAPVNQQSIRSEVKQHSHDRDAHYANAAKRNERSSTMSRQGHPATNASTPAREKQIHTVEKHHERQTRTTVEKTKVAEKRPSTNGTSVNSESNSPDSGMKESKVKQRKDPDFNKG